MSTTVAGGSLPGGTGSVSSGSGSGRRAPATAAAGLPQESRAYGARAVRVAERKGATVVRCGHRGVMGEADPRLVVVTRRGIRTSPSPPAPLVINEAAVADGKRGMDSGRT